VADDQRIKLESIVVSIIDWFQKKRDEKAGKSEAVIKNCTERRVEGLMGVWGGRKDCVVVWLGIWNKRMKRRKKQRGCKQQSHLGLAWLGLAWLGLAWLGLAWLGLA